jgi:hypothetical protein
MSESRKGSIAIVAGILIMVGCLVWIYDISYIGEFNPFLLATALLLFILGVLIIIWGSGKNP